MNGPGKTPSTQPLPCTQAKHSKELPVDLEVIEESIERILDTFVEGGEYSTMEGELQRILEEVGSDKIVEDLLPG